MTIRRLRHSPIARHLSAVAAYLLLSLLVTYPLAGRFFTEALGEDYPDRVQMMWNFWWVKTALLVEHGNPFHTDMLFYPYGADLYFHWLNLPLALVALGPQLLFGIIAGYNFAMIFALVLAGYAGWRLAYYLTGNWPAALVAGIIIGFNALGVISTRSQINLVNSGPFILCIEFYLRTWERGRPRDGILTGLFFTLALLTVGYYEVHLLVFFAVHLVWLLLTAPERPWRARLLALARRARPVAGWAGGTALLLAGPYVVGAVLDVVRGELAPESPLDAFRSVLNSSDVLSLVLPFRQHWLLGAQMPWWAGIDPAIHDRTYLGLVGVALAVVGIWAGRRRTETWLWVAVAAVGLVLALGPILQINRQDTFFGAQVSLPFGWIQNLPPFSLVRFPERFTMLTYVALGVLAAQAIAEPRRAQFKTQNSKLKIGYAVILALLLLDLPLYARTTTPLAFPASITALAQNPTPGPILELPFTKHDWPDAIRMYYAIDHGRATTSGYLSRTIPDPYGAACAPFHAFVRYRPEEAHDVVTPSVDAQLPALIAQSGIAFVVVYKIQPATSTTFDPLPGWELADLQGVAARTGPVVADDAVATIYQIRPLAPPGLFLQLGTGWYDLETSNGAPFRWMDGPQADLCVDSPAAQTAPLSFQVISFNTPRHLQVWVNNQQVLDTTIPAGFAPQTVMTPPLAWPVGPQLVRLTTPDADTSPASLGQGADSRALGLGFFSIRLGAEAP